jgi:hypothetical protein
MTTTKRKAPSLTQPSNNAQRQADYRARHLKSEDGQLQRLNLMIDLHAKCALERLASCYGVTQKSMLERLIQQAQEVALLEAEVISPNGPADYYAGRLGLPMAFVTQ